MGDGLRMHDRLGRLRHARNHIPPHRRANGHRNRHCDWRGSHADRWNERLLSDEAQPPNGRYVFLCERSLRARPCIPLRMVPEPFLPDGRVLERQRSVRSHPHHIRQQHPNRTPLHDCRQRGLSPGNWDVSPRPDRRRHAVHLCKAFPAAPSYRSCHHIARGRCRNNGHLHAARAVNGRNLLVRYSRRQQWLRNIQPDHPCAMGLRRV